MSGSVTVNCEWGLNGIKKFLPVTDVFIIIDVLSFSTCVDAALSRGGVIYPYRYKDESAENYAEKNNAVLVSFKRSLTEYSLSPTSLTNITPGTKLVLPSPNGSELSLATGKVKTLCACLRNAQAVADYAMSLGGNITVIPAGERWEDGSIRFAIEDYLGGGAVISYLKGELSAESRAAMDIYNSSKSNLKQIITESVSGRELIEKGFSEDISIACEVNSGGSVPLLKEYYYINNNDLRQ